MLPARIMAEPAGELLPQDRKSHENRRLLRAYFPPIRAPNRHRDGKMRMSQALGSRPVRELGFAIVDRKATVSASMIFVIALFPGLTLANAFESDDKKTHGGCPLFPKLAKM